jgi:hypothetical protein
MNPDKVIEEIRKIPRVKQVEYFPNWSRNTFDFVFRNDNDERFGVGMKANLEDSLCENSSVINSLFDINFILNGQTR